jgi:hypothetical protein
LHTRGTQILSRDKNMQMAKLQHKEQEARKPISEMLQQLRVKINGVDNVDTFNHIIKNWMREQKGKKEHKEQKGSLIDDKDGGKKKTYCLYVCAQIYHGDEVRNDAWRLSNTRRCADGTLLSLLAADCGRHVHQRHPV